jgi:5'-nucleotidase
VFSLPPNVGYRDFVETGRELATRLRSPEGGNCDLVFALTHMRVPNDELCARELDDVVDLVLGGHDHFVHYGGAVCQTDAEGQPIDHVRPDDGGLRLIKSGCDFHDLSLVELVIGHEDGRRRIHGIKGKCGCYLM